MKVTFLGTGTSMGVPVAGGFGRENIYKDPRNERYRCSVWVQTKRNSILIDATPEFRLQSIRAGIKNIDLVLITHEHMDHISGIDDLRAYNYVQKKPIPLLSSRRCLESIEKRFDYLFGEAKYPGSVNLDTKEIDSAIEFNGDKIIPIPVMHGNLKILGFRINNFSYLTDVKEISGEAKEIIRGSKVLVLSGLRWKEKHPTHLTIPEAVGLAAEIGVPENYLIHMNASVDHETSNKCLPKHVKLAFDQQVLEL